jgi:MFS family permease
VQPPSPPPRGLRDRRPAWLTAPVLTVAALSVGSGLAAFGVTAVMADVAATFGETGNGDAVRDQLGLPATTLGVALSIIRLASLGSLPAAALADRHGRRSVLLTVATLGFGLTVLAALAPSFWIYVALVTLARPGLASINALSGVIAAEEATATDRSAAIALITAAYGIGAGLVSVGRGVLPGEPSFRLVTGFALVPLLLLPLLARRIREPAIAVAHHRTEGIPGTVPRSIAPRVALLAILAGSIAIATGPGFTYLFIYGEGILGASPLFLSTLVLAAGPAGLVGLLLGRAAADRFGRRPTAGVAMAVTGLAVGFAYAGGTRELAIGYLGSIVASSAFAPPAGALAAELVPTAIRATVAGWVTVAGVLAAVLGLTSFGVLADRTGTFGAASFTLGVLVAVVAVGFRWLPETRGVELEELETDEP